MTPTRDSSRKQKSAQVKIRKAKPSDKSPVLEISKKIWSRHDYLPQVWDDWLADKNARLTVATVNGKTVGVAHASLQTPHIALARRRQNPRTIPRTRNRWKAEQGTRRMGQKKTCPGRTPQHRQLEPCVQKTSEEDWIPSPADLPEIRHEQRTPNQTCHCQHATRLCKASLELVDRASRV